MWPGVTPVNASWVNTTYLDAVEDIVNRAAQYGIVVSVFLVCLFLFLTRLYRR
jgi:hypothetical protein